MNNSYRACIVSYILCAMSTVKKTNNHMGIARDIFIGGGRGAFPPLNFDNPKRSRIWEAYVVVRLAAT